MKGGRGFQQNDSENIFISPIAWYFCKDGVNSNQLTELEFQLEFLLDDYELELFSLSFCFMH